MRSDEMEEVVFDLRVLDDSSQRLLDSYKKLGSVRHLTTLCAKEVRRNRRVRMLKKFSGILYWAVMLSLLTWVFTSWLNIVSHNSMPNPEYYPWNLFTLLF